MRALFLKVVPCLCAGDLGRAWSIGLRGCQRTDPARSLLMICPRSMKITRSATALAKPIISGDAEHGHPLGASSTITSSTSCTHLRIQRRRRLVEQHDLGIHAPTAGDGDPLLPPESCPGYLSACSGIRTRRRKFMAIPGPLARQRGPRWAPGSSSPARSDGEEVEVLEHHAHLPGAPSRCSEIGGQGRCRDQDVSRSGALPAG